MPPVGGFREETISKEKQKFFRLNSFYGIKVKGQERCKVEGRLVRDVSSSSSSSTSEGTIDIHNSKIERIQSNTSKLSSVGNTIFGENKPKLLINSKNVSAKTIKTGVATNEEKTINEPFSSFHTFGQCITFEDLAKKCKANSKSEEELPIRKNNTNWLQKLKSTDIKNSSWKNNASRIFSTKKKVNKQMSNICSNNLPTISVSLKIWLPARILMN